MKKKQSIRKKFYVTLKSFATLGINKILKLASSLYIFNCRCKSKYDFNSLRLILVW
jgi:hypothetical protein